MLALAASRRSGDHPAYDEPDSETWGAAVGALPDLKMFELILEAIVPKEQQLGTVVECATKWKFPLKGTPYELVCDGKTGALQWSWTPRKVRDDRALAQQSGEQSQTQGHHHEAVHTLPDTLEPPSSAASSSGTLGPAGAQ
ncbi:hypothetical protein P171DRAFT_507731 [Karstenula rhodostoma CBS 690.94]|uniref:Uncharacterized protein n=1 Tax=Karstenula rhodostoma CBS 690.94 TaxID=1392251 RepID=A0A9P4UI45_9PLEO|nr:hypothetical protein P171DRAFT_507731 [Karstenula rhodostoma CBS 690.94]